MEGWNDGMCGIRRGNLVRVRLDLPMDAVERGVTECQPIVKNLVQIEFAVLQIESARSFVCTLNLSRIFTQYFIFHASSSIFTTERTKISITLGLLMDNAVQT